MTIETRHALANALKKAIKETNRSIMLNGIFSDVIQKNHSMYCLFKTWMCREVRSITGYIAMNYIMENISLQFFEDKQTISKVVVDDLKKWGYSSSSEDVMKECREILNNLNYKELEYKPVLSSKLVGHEEYSKQISVIDVVKNIDIDSVLNFKFS